MYDSGPCAYRGDEIDAGIIYDPECSGPTYDQIIARPATNAAVMRYIGAIRNERKRDYARRFWRWLRDNDASDEPDRGNLSVMGAQAVHMCIGKILDRYPDH